MRKTAGPLCMRNEVNSSAVNTKNQMVQDTHRKVTPRNTGKAESRRRIKGAEKEQSAKLLSDDQKNKTNPANSHERPSGKERCFLSSRE